MYHARLQVVEGSESLRLTVIDAEKLSDNFRCDNAEFDSQTGVLKLPFVNVAQVDNSIATFSAELELVTGQTGLTFELKQATRLK